MRILVTGGAGFVGSHLVHDLLLQGHEVVVVDNFSSGSPVRLAEVHRRTGRHATVMCADVRSMSAMTAALDGVSVVIHLAAHKSVRASWNAPEDYIDNNIGGMRTVLSAMARVGVRRILYASSAAVYGSSTHVPIAEEATPNPKSPYAQTKMMGEQLLAQQADRLGWSAVSLRYFNPVGADLLGGLTHVMGGDSGLVPRALQAICDPSAPLTVFGTAHGTPDGTCVRDYIDIRDLVRAHLLVLVHMQTPGHHVFNLSTGRSSSVLDVLAACERVTGRPVPHVFGDPRRGDPAMSIGSAQKVARLTGFQPSYSLDDMVGSVWWARAVPTDHSPKSVGGPWSSANALPISSQSLERPEPPHPRP